MITVTLIRHGESEYNIKGLWSGWNNPSLTTLGELQAKALGSTFAGSSTHFTHIYSSDLIRTQATALAILESHPEPKPLLQTTPNIREQHFGIAEGRAWSPPRLPGDDTLDQLYKQGIFPRPEGFHDKFPEGESLNDVTKRVDEFIRDCILSCLFGEGSTPNAHIAISSHGNCLSAMIPALLKLDPEADCTKSYRGQRNTAWTRLHISLREPFNGNYDPSSPPPLDVRLITFNNDDHVTSLKPSLSDGAEDRAGQKAASADIVVEVA